MQQVCSSYGQLNVTILRFDSISTPHAISTRLGGVSKGPLQSANIADGLGDPKAIVAANRKLICAAAQLDGRRFACMEQMHSDAIAVVGPDTQCIDHAVPVGGIDALICNRRDTTLMAQSADCPLLLLYDSKAPAIAVIHSGWRSTLANIAGKTVQRMADEFQCIPETIQAAISPCICQKHYEVGKEVSDQFLNTYPTLPHDDFLTVCSSEKRCLDLTAVITWQLKAAGVVDVEVANICTYEREDLLYSHRRDHGNTGRFGLFAQLW